MVTVCKLLEIQCYGDIYEPYLHLSSCIMLHAIIAVLTLPHLMQVASEITGQ